jgi:hypothetical protein
MQDTNKHTDDSAERDQSRRDFVKATVAASAGLLIVPAMPIQQIHAPYIKFHFAGIVALCVKEGNDFFDAGIIKGVDDNGEIDNHHHSITVNKLVKGQAPETLLVINQENPARLLRLVMSNQARSTPGIVFFNEANKIDAAAGEDNKLNYDLVLDVEKRIYNGKKVNINNKALRSVLRVSGNEQGMFYTKEKSKAPIIIENGDLGDVAFSVGALISLPASGAILRKLNERSGKYEQVIQFEHQNDVTYEIVIENVCSGDECIQSSVDHIYNDFIKGPEDGRKILFVNPVSSRTHDSTPESGCPVLGISSNDHLPDP